MAMVFTKTDAPFWGVSLIDREGILREIPWPFFCCLFLKQFFFSWWHVIVYSDWMPSLSCVHKLLQIKSSWMIEMSHIESPSLHVRRFGGRAVPKSFCARSPESTKFWPSIGEGKQSVDIWDVYGWSFLRDCFGWIQECWTKSLYIWFWRCVQVVFAKIVNVWVRLSMLCFCFECGVSLQFQLEIEQSNLHLLVPCQWHGLKLMKHWCDSTLVLYIKYGTSNR